MIPRSKSVVPTPGSYQSGRLDAVDTVNLANVALVPPRGDEPAATSADLERVSRVRSKDPDTVPPSQVGADRAARKRASALVDDLTFAGPGSALVFLEPIRSLGPIGLEAIARAFPGAIWFDRHAKVGREPEGRWASALSSLLHALGEPAFPTIESLLGSSSTDVRYYAALLALDLDAPAFESSLRTRLFDPDLDVSRLALTYIRRDPGRSERAISAIERSLAHSERGSASARLRASALLLVLRGESTGG